MTTEDQEESRRWWKFAGLGFEFVGVTVASTAFGGDEVVAILKRQVKVP